MKNVQFNPDRQVYAGAQQQRSERVNDHSGVKVYKIRAAVLRKKGGPLKIESLEMEGPREDEVLVRLFASGICHTDIDFCSGWVEADKAVILGHEGAGVVERVGKSVKGVRRGDHVVLSYQSCGRCRQCRSGHPAHCQHFYEANFGFQRLDGSNALQRSGVRGHFFGQSSFALSREKRDGRSDGGFRSAYLVKLAILLQGWPRCSNYCSFAPC